VLNPNTRLVSFSIDAVWFQSWNNELVCFRGFRSVIVSSLFDHHVADQNVKLSKTMFKNGSVIVVPVAKIGIGHVDKSSFW
jgi:hypothetical protein